MHNFCIRNSEAIRQWLVLHIGKHGAVTRETTTVWFQASIIYLQIQWRTCWLNNPKRDESSSSVVKVAIKILKLQQKFNTLRHYSLSNADRRKINSQKIFLKDCPMRVLPINRANYTGIWWYFNRIRSNLIIQGRISIFFFHFWACKRKGKDETELKNFTSMWATSNIHTHLPALKRSPSGASCVKKQNQYTMKDGVAHRED